MQAAVDPDSSSWARAAEPGTSSVGQAKRGLASVGPSSGRLDEQVRRAGGQPGTAAGDRPPLARLRLRVVEGGNRRDLRVHGGAELCVRAVARPGDTIAVESPTYFGMLQIIEAGDEDAGGLDLSAPRMCLDALDYATRRHSQRGHRHFQFSEPAGSCMPTEKKRLFG